MLSRHINKFKKVQVFKNDSALKVLRNVQLMHRVQPTENQYFMQLVNERSL